MTITRLVTLALLLTSNLCRAQITSIDYLLDFPNRDTVDFSVTNLPSNTFKLDYRFDRDVFIDKSILDTLRKGRITRVDFVFTKFRSVEDFDQRRLNERRLLALQRAFPDLFDNNLIEWRFYQQTGSNSREEANQQFHGLVFHLENPWGFELERPLTTEEEIAMIKLLLGDTTFSTIAGSDVSSLLPDKLPCDTVRLAIPHKRIKYEKFTRDEPSGKFIPRWKGRAERGVLCKRSGIFPRAPHIEEVADSTAATEFYTVEVDTFCCGCELTLPDSMVIAGADIAAYWDSRGQLMGDSVVFAVLNRNQDWSNYLIVEDVTGSMSPYIAQTFLWRRKTMKTQNASHFAFFNDGDSNPDARIGKSNGVHSIFSDSTAAVEELAYATMRKGNGGRCPENDIEAMIRGIEAQPDCESVILIADNYATVRDMTLLPKLAALGKPVRILVCGSYQARVSHYYLSIAAATNGSVHSLHEDLMISKMMSGEKITVGDQTFRWLNGNLVLTH